MLVHGPFPVALAQLAIAVGALAMAAMFVAFAFDDARLDCDRAADLCTYRGSSIFQRVDRFRLSRLRGVKVDIELGQKNSRYGIPTLDLTDSQFRLKSTTPAEAERFARALERERAGARPVFSLALEAERGFAIPGVVFSLIALTALFAALRRAGRVTIVVDPGVLRLSRSLFRVPIWSGAVELDGVVDVEVEWEWRTPLWSRSKRTHGRLVLLRGAGAEPLTPVAFPGYHLHLRARAALCQVLALPQRSRAREEAHAARALEFMPRALPGGVAATLVLAWMGAAGGAIVGLTLSGAAIAVLGLTSAAAPIVGVGMGLGAVLGVAAGVALARASTR